MVVMSRAEELETERLLLRQFRESDLDAYHAFCSDEEVMRFLGPTLNRADAWRSMATVLGHWKLRGYGMWAVAEKSSGALVGRIGPWKPEGWPELEIGWTLARQFWGHGYATEAAKASRDYAFRELGATHVISLIDRRNVASIRVAERIGETFEREITVNGNELLQYGVQRRAGL